MVWESEDIQTLMRLRREGRTFVEIGKALDKSANAVGSKYSRLTGSSHGYQRKPPPDPEQPPRPLGVHLISYNLARRGFHVPEEQEGQYFDLLREGVPIAEAVRRLGLASHSNS